MVDDAVPMALQPLRGGDRVGECDGASQGNERFLLEDLCSPDSAGHSSIR